MLMLERKTLDELAEHIGIAVMRLTDMQGLKVVLRPNVVQLPHLAAQIVSIAAGHPVIPADELHFCSNGTSIMGNQIKEVQS